MIDSQHKLTYWTGVAGLIGAILVGAGEFLLHYDIQERFSNNEFFLGISDTRTTWGHFFAVAGAPFYLVGVWHARLMLKPASEKWSLIAFFLLSYGLMLGFVWIGSRANLSALMNAPMSDSVQHMIALYDLRYETLLQVTRFAVLIFSLIFIALVWTGRTAYPKWMVVLNPILLIVASFILYFFISKTLGRYLMPIALNVAFAIFFLASLFFVGKNPTQENNKK